MKLFSGLNNLTHRTLIQLPGLVLRQQQKYSGQEPIFLTVQLAMGRKHLRDCMMCDIGWSNGVSRQLLCSLSGAPSDLAFVILIRKFFRAWCVLRLYDFTGLVSWYLFNMYVEFVWWLCSLYLNGCWSARRSDLPSAVPWVIFRRIYTWTRH